MQLSLNITLAILLKVQVVQLLNFSTSQDNYSVTADLHFRISGGEHFKFFMKSPKVLAAKAKTKSIMGTILDARNFFKFLLSTLLVFTLQFSFTNIISQFMLIMVDKDC